uniref:Uncharacterized protein n=1 Tax=viral metagenome TaxID=1070528 RepID=A0A6C0DRB0_9ZZZZ
MKFTKLLLCMVKPEPIIKNLNVPSCRNCIYYKPNVYDGDFTSSYTKCEKFGNKNIITGEIKYGFADLCRNDESKCGTNGKYFEEEPNINMKILKYKLISNIPYSLAFLFTSFFVYIVTHK